MKTLQAELGLLEAQKNVGNQYSQALQTTNMQMSADQAERLKKKREEEKVKSLEQAQTKLDTLTKEFDEFKKSKMTEEEKKKQLELEEKTKYETALAEAEKIKTNYTRLTRESKVKEVLGVYANDEEVKKIIPSFIADDEETSISNATIFKQFIEKQKEDAKTKALEDAARTIPQPQGQIPPKVEPFKVPDIF